MSFWVYILKCADGSYYTGHTDSLDKRVGEHQSGVAPNCYTFSRRPIILVFSQPFPSRLEALCSERQIKGWNRGKKEALIAGDWMKLSSLSRSKNALNQSRSKVPRPFGELRGRHER